MKKELLKLASDLDRMGYKRLANEVDSLLGKVAGLYKSQSEGSKWPDVGNDLDRWFDKSRFEQLPEGEILNDYKAKIRNKMVSSPEEYIEYMEVQPWQLDKVKSALSSEFITETPDSSQNSEEVTAEDFHKLLIADKDSATPYKMSDQTFQLGTKDRITSGSISALKGKLTPDELRIIREK
jgi:hypothetical protein